MDRYTVSLEDLGAFPAVTCLHVLLSNLHYLEGTVPTFGRLQKLTVGPKWSFVNNAPVTIDLEWRKLVELQVVEISGPTIFGDSILQLAELPKLKQVCLRSFRCGDALTSQNVAALSALIAMQLPKVEMVIDQVEDTKAEMVLDQVEDASVMCDEEIFVQLLGIGDGS